LQLRKIVVGVDFTDASLAAARWAATHFAPDAEIVLVHVMPSVRVPSFVRAHLPPPAEVAPATARALYGGLRGLADLIAGRRARAQVLRGGPAEALGLIAEEVGADVLCVGRGRRRRGSARFGATTPQRLLACTGVPTLVVPAGRFETPDRVVVAVDERAGGKYLFAAACRLAAAFEAGIDALHVIEPELQHFVTAVAEVRDSAGEVRRNRALDARDDAGDGLHESWLQARARAWVDAMLDEAEPDGAWTASVIQCGDAGQEIIRHAREHRADLIVLGRGGDVSDARAEGRLPLGSTARLVLWAAPCPVLVLPLDASTAGLTLPDRERGHYRTNPDVIALPSARGGSSGWLPPPARHLGERETEGAV
jgi:nucleotide-binding universal stress UspA family protein